MNVLMWSRLTLNLMLFIPFINSLAYEAETYDESVHYILKIKCPSCNSIPRLCAYHKGYKLELDNGFCMFWQPKKSQNFILVITEQVNYKGNNIKHLERIPKKPCRLFFIDPSYNKETSKTDGWSIEEEKFENLPIKLPQSALVILMNPDHIDTLQSRRPTKPVKSNSEDNCNVIYLPEIILKKNITNADLKACSMLSLFASIDSNAVHVDHKKQIRQGHGVVIALNDTNRC